MINEQFLLIQQLNDFLARRGLKANYVATEVGISINSFYNFKGGKSLLTKTQANRLKEYIDNYEQKLSI